MPSSNPSRIRLNSPVTASHAASLGLFALSLGLPALHMQSVNGYSDAHYTGLDCLAFGWRTLGSQAAWLANACFALAFILSMRSFRLFAALVGAAGVAISFSTFELLKQTHAFFDPSAHNIQVGAVDIGFYFWLAAQGLLVLVSATLVAFTWRGRRVREANATGTASTAARAAD